MTDVNVVDPPALPGFSEHYGVRVAIIGEDGDTFIAMGWVEKRRALAAFIRMCRVDLGWRIGDEIPYISDIDLGKDLRHELWTVAETCGRCPGDADCCECADIRAADWWLRPAATSEVAFAVTVFSP